MPVLYCACRKKDSSCSGYKSCVNVFVIYFLSGAITLFYVSSSQDLTNPSVTGNIISLLPFRGLENPENSSSQPTCHPRDQSLSVSYPRQFRIGSFLVGKEQCMARMWIK